MTKLAVPIMVRSVARALADAVRAAELGADLVEFRIDTFAEHFSEVPQLVERSALPCILTCRPTWEGGHFAGSESERIDLYHLLAEKEVQPAYLDVELLAWQRSPALRNAVSAIVDHPAQTRATTTGLILSSHDFETRPRDLYQRIEAMTAATACRVMKLAWRARSLRDNLEAFEILTQHHKPTIALCMGDFGLPSRVLARKFGALLTFASLDAQLQSAPGQPTVHQIKSLYRWDALNAETRVYGVIGYPVGHSLSPHVHNAGFDAIDYNGVYLPMPIPPEYEHFKATVGAWLDLEPLHFRGASVTIPHKQNLLRFVRASGGVIEPLAEAIGAANTLTVADDGTLHASNTDCAAARDAVCDDLGIAPAELKGMRVAVIGAGGAARAVVAGFAQHGATVVIYNRSVDKAEALANDMQQLPGAGKVVPARLEKLCDSCCQIYINCTPIGMHPNVDASPIPQSNMPTGKGWGPGTVVFDTVYNPVETKLLREARAAGCVTIPGTEMFIRQAAMQFQTWTNTPAPLPTFRTTLETHLPQSDK